MEQVYSVADFQAVFNQIVETAFSGVIIEGEVASYKLNQGKFVFFDLKDEECSLGCFMMAFAQRFPLEDGMRVRVRGVPKMTKWGKLSLTVQAIVPVGEGSLKKSFELLKKKLGEEGLFAPERKRRIPNTLGKIGVISSTQAAGYADFCKIVNERWGGIELVVAHTQVQGMVAADQIIRALNYFNERNEVEAVVIIRGGGSADDLAVFNDEKLVRAVAASRIPVMTGIGHEVDTSLCDLAADVVASTPSNAAQLLTRDKREVLTAAQRNVLRVRELLLGKITELMARTTQMQTEAKTRLLRVIQEATRRAEELAKIVQSLDPRAVLKRGYAIVRAGTAQLKTGDEIEIEMYAQTLTAKIEAIKEN